MANFQIYPNLRQRIRRFPLAAQQTFPEGAPIQIDASGNAAVSDENPIAGFACHAAGELPEVGYVLVALALPGSTFIGQGDRAPLATDISDSFGLETDGDGDWRIDTGTSDCLQIEKVYIGGGRDQFEFSVLPGRRQFESGA